MPSEDIRRIEIDIIEWLLVAGMIVVLMFAICVLDKEAVAERASLALGCFAWKLGESGKSA